MSNNETTMSILVYNRPDVLARIAATFSARGYNIESISANTTMNSDITKIIITTRHDKEVIRKLEKQLARLVDVIQVEDLSNGQALHREMLLVLVAPPADEREQLERLAAQKGWKILDKSERGYHIEVTGDQTEIAKSLLLLGPFDVKDYTRTGVVSLGTGIRFPQ